MVIPTELSRLLQSAREDSIVWPLATQIALDWTLNLTSTSTSSVKGKELEQPLVHWYCGKEGHESCWDSAVFLVRLLSYKRAGDVLLWRDQFERLIKGCCDCVRMYQVAKREFRERYLTRNKPETAIKTFMDGLEKFELLFVLTEFANAGITHLHDEGLAGPSSSTLDAVPPATVYNCVVNPLLFQNPRIIAVLKAGLPLLEPLPFPNVVVAGLLALLVHSAESLRVWAKLQLDLCELVSAEQFQENRLEPVVQEVLYVLACRAKGEQANSHLVIDYTVARLPFWHGISVLLSTLSTDTIRQHLLAMVEFNIVHLVVSHLSDKEGDHLEEVLATFRTLLERLGQYFWATGEENYNEVVLRLILENDLFEQLFVALTSGSPNQPLLDWLPPFLSSVAHSMERFTKTIAYVSNVFLDRFQKTRFAISARTAAIQFALETLTEVFVAHEGEGALPWPHAPTAAKTIELHSLFIAQLAFAKEYAIVEWAPASSVALLFVGAIGERDCKRLVANIYALAEFEAASKEASIKKSGNASSGTSTPRALPAPPLRLVVAGTIWDSAYDLVRSNDIRGIGVLLASVTSSCHLAKLESKAWTSSRKIRVEMEAVNGAMDLIRPRLVELLMSLADESTELLRNFLAQPGVAIHLVVLLFSPTESEHNMAQGLVKQAFDVTTRRECFQSLLANFPDETLRGVSFAIKAFVKSARLLPEACGMAKRLVRCLSDVIDVLCDQSDGLLRETSFQIRLAQGGVKNRLLSFWKSMCEALGLVFSRTPTWAAFYENDEMTEWMRDAILFGQEMVQQVRTFEMASRGEMSGTTASPGIKGQSGTGRVMLEALNVPLEHVAGWLRLTDVELLGSSYDLVFAMIDRFARSGSNVQAETGARIKRIVNSGLKHCDESNGRSYRLSREKLEALLEAIEAQEADESDDSDVEIVDPKAIKSKDQREWWSKAMSGASSGSTSDIKVPPSLLGTTRKPCIAVARPVPVSSIKLPLPARPITGPGQTVSGLARQAKPFPNFGRPAMKSAVRPRGVPWTTYSSTTRADSSDSSDGEQGAPRGLALLAKTQKAPVVKKVERRSVKLLDIGQNGRKGSGGKDRRTHEAKSIANSLRLRGVQDFSALHRKVLQWDYGYGGPVPPDTPTPRNIPASFANADSYFDHFEPLLLLECWQQLQSAKIQALSDTPVVPCNIAGRQSVDDFVDVFLTIDHGRMPDRMHFGDSDLVLLRQGGRIVIAKVQASGRKREFFEMTLRCHFGNDVHDAASGLLGRTKWEIVKLFSLNTIHREYSAVQSLRYLELVDDILQPRPPPLVQPDTRTIQATMSAYQVNQPQAVAIVNSLKHSGFSLIQGPPGTGKTKTIVGLIGAFIQSRPRPASGIAAGRPSDPDAVEPVAKVLLCAPSNAAVDEVAKRLKDGIRGVDGCLFFPKVVRIGSDQAVDISVKDIFIDELVERELSGAKAAAGASDAQSNMHTIRAEVDTLRGERDGKKMELDSMDHNDARKAELSLELKKVKSRIFELSQRLDSEKDKMQQNRRAMDAQQKRVRIKILSEADVICSTLSGSGHDYMSQLPFDFETVIIDEAAQSIELSSLIPLKYGCRRCILVGDPNQLPPTVTSRPAANAGYDRSLFVRMMSRGGPSSVNLLSIQYRMHPNISAFPSAAFYNSRLSDGPSMEVKTAQPWHTSPLFPPYCFMHVRGGSEQSNRVNSISNPQEAATAVALYERLRRQYPSIDFDYRIGVVTPYKGQVGELKKQFRQAFGEDILSKLSFNTVDGFQGQEKDIIILSCVRGGTADKGVGFLKDTRRMNVALTRARSSLFILGDSHKLRSNQYWNNLITDAASRGLLLEVDPATFRAIAPSLPPTIRSAPVPISRSNAASILSAPGPVVALLTPREISALSQATKRGPSSLASGDAAGSAKRRVSEAMEHTPAPIRKLPAVQTTAPRPPSPMDIDPPAISPVVVPTSTPLSVPAGIVRQQVKRPTSLFLPKKRPLPTTNRSVSGPSKLPPRPGPPPLP